LGGCGFVGRRFCRRFLDYGYDVVAVDSMIAGVDPHHWFAQPSSRNRLTFVKADVRDFFRTEPASSFDLVVHCAAVVGGRLLIDGDPLAVATDLAIDADLFNWIVRGNDKPKLIYFSSSAVYPIELQTKANHCALSESLTNFDTTRVGLPDLTYGWAKLSGEYLARFAAKHYGLDVVIYRPFGGYGEDQSFDYPFPSIICRIVTGENPVTVWGSGDQQRDFIHIEDICDAVLATMNLLKPGQPLNLGTGRGMSFRELARIASDVLKIPVDIVNDASKPEGVFSRVADVYQLQRWWKPSIPLDMGIRRVAKALTTS
jgi:GDP-L-fucose synthase